jgi:hypothetical protein
MNPIFRFSRNFDENQVGRPRSVDSGRRRSDRSQHPLRKSELCTTRSYAYHGAHPFTVLYWAAHTLDHLGDVILVGGDPEITSCMGLKRADSVAEALEMAQDTVGRVRVRPTCTSRRCLCAR